MKDDDRFSGIDPVNVERHEQKAKDIYDKVKNFFGGNQKNTNDALNNAHKTIDKAEAYVGEKAQKIVPEKLRNPFTSAKEYSVKIDGKARKILGDDFVDKAQQPLKTLYEKKARVFKEAATPEFVDTLQKKRKEWKTFDGIKKDLITHTPDSFQSTFKKAEKKFKKFDRKHDKWKNLFKRLKQKDICVITDGPFVDVDHAFLTLEFNEGISQDFEIQYRCLLRMNHEDYVKEVDDWLYKPMGLSLKYGNAHRCVHGVIASVEAERWHHDSDYPENYDYVIARVTARPQPCNLIYERRFRSFIKQNPKKIVETVLGDTPMKWQAKTSQKKPWMQYNEDSWHFCRRIFHAFGLQYLYEHEEKNHKLVVVDDLDSSSSSSKKNSGGWLNLLKKTAKKTLIRQARSHIKMSGDANLLLDMFLKKKNQPLTLQAETHPLHHVHYEGELLWLRFHKHIETQKVSMRQYDAQAPEKDLHVEAGDQECVAQFIDQSFDSAEEGEKHAQYAQEIYESRTAIYSGASLSLSLEPNKYFSANILDDELRVVRITHYFSSYEEDFAEFFAQKKYRYRNVFDAVVKSAAYRANLNVREPKSFGVHTAKVVGSATNKDHPVFIKKTGEICIRFWWDESYQDGADLGPNDALGCFARLSQGLAGKGWGVRMIPRVDQEVLVVFAEGDLTKPIVVGALYHKKHPLPDGAGSKKNNDYATTIRTHVIGDSNPKSRDGHEISFIDRFDQEEFYTYAPGDATHHVKRHRTLYVQEDHRTILRCGDRHTLIEGKERKKTHKTAKGLGNDTLLLKKGNRHIILEGKGEKPAQHLTKVHKGDVMVQTKKGHIKHILEEGDHHLINKKGHAKCQLDRGNMEIKLQSGNRTTNIKGNDTLTITSGALKIKVQQGEIVISGMKVRIEGQESLHLSAKGQVKIEGTDVSIKSKGQIAIEGAAAKFIGKGSMQVASSGVTTIKGTMVKLG